MRIFEGAGADGAPAERGTVLIGYGCEDKVERGGGKRRIGREREREESLSLKRERGFIDNQEVTEGR